MLSRAFDGLKKKVVPGRSLDHFTSDTNSSGTGSIGNIYYLNFEQEILIK